MIHAEDDEDRTLNIKMANEGDCKYAPVQNTMGIVLVCSAQAEGNELAGSHIQTPNVNVIHFIFLLFYFQICVYCCELLDTTALLELGTQAFSQILLRCWSQEHKHLDR